MPTVCAIHTAAGMSCKREIDVNWGLQAKSLVEARFETFEPGPSGAIHSILSTLVDRLVALKNTRHLSLKITAISGNRLFHL